MRFRFAACAASLAVAVSAIAAPTLEQLGEFPVKEANQGVGVDADHFYAVVSDTIYRQVNQKMVSDT